MRVWDLSNLLPLTSDAVQLLLLIILVARGIYKLFPIFTGFILWELASDLLAYVALGARQSYLGHHYIQLYYVLFTVNYLIELAVLFEIASTVFRPAKRAVSRGILYFLLVGISAVGLVSFFVAAELNVAPFFSLRIFMVMDTTAAILCVLVFLLIAGFSQLLGLNWKNHVLQLATGLAFYSLVELAVELAHSQLHAGPSYADQYQFWSKFEVVGYLCTLSFWCFVFLKKEAPRKEFSPQMQKILVLLSGSAKKQRAVFARSREH